VFSDPYDAVKGSHAIVVCTEWDEFVTLDYQRIYDSMAKPAYLFDGRKIVDHDKLIEIGFHVVTIGKRMQRSGITKMFGQHIPS
jgi:UDPglucose 6-dehydrogenase